MSEFPEDLIAEILSHLPAKSLLRFRCVSKQWCALIDSSNFINLQLNQSLRTYTNLSLIFENCAVHELCCLGFDSLDDIMKRHDYNFPPVKLECPPPELEKDFDIVGSCNGLICLLTFSDNVVPILLNPSTKKHQILPPVPSPYFRCTSNSVYGFGYDRVNDDYKIVSVRFLYDQVPYSSEVFVFSLRSNVWRRINHSFPHLHGHNCCSAGVLFNGALHWVTVNNFIAAFDLVVENYREVQLPNTSKYWSVTLGDSGGCLWLGCIDDDYLIELWVMKNYMVQESWTKHSLAFCSQVYKGLYSHRVRILPHSKSSTQVLLIEINSKLHWLDLKQQKVVDLGLRSPGVEICITSLVKLVYDHGTDIL